MGDLTTIASCEGYQILGTAPARFPLRAGVTAVQETYTMTPKDAQAFMDSHGGQPVTLKIGSNKIIQEVQKLYPIKMLPGDDPFHLRVVLADRRIWWDRRRIVKGYNIHRNVGTVRTDTTGVDEVDPTVANIQYCAWSLRDPKAGVAGKWDAVSAFEDVMQEVKLIEQEYNGERFTWTLLEDAITFQMPVEQLTLNDSARDAVRRMLAYFPGSDLFIDAEGQAVIFNRNSGDDLKIVDGAGAPAVGRGYVGTVDFRYLCPAKVRVYFAREPEVRHNISEAGSINDTTVALGEGRTLTNVIAVPDFTIDLRPLGGGAAYTAAQFTYVDFHQYLIAINADLAAAPFGDLDAIDYSLLQQAFVPGMGLWNSFRANGSLNPSANWIARIGALEDAYRQDYMVNPFWTDRSLVIRASSILTLDNALGQRGPARVYADYCVIPSMSGEVKAWQETEKIEFAQNVKGYPKSGVLGPTVKPARGTCEMLHEDQGVFKIVWKENKLGLDDIVLPSMIEIVTEGQVGATDAEGKPILGGPDSHLANTPDVISFDSASDENTYCKLTSSYKGCVILTHVPAAPNSKAQLQEIVVEPGDVAGMLPAGLKLGIGAAQGPIMDVVIGSTVETARIPWQDTDEHAKIIEGLFGLTGAAAPSSDQIRDRIVNYGVSSVRTGASLLAIAQAAAARVYSAFANRQMGQMAVALNPNLEPAGRISEVTHEITSRGEGFTTLIMPEDVQEMDFMAFLPDSARAILLKMPGIDRKRGS